MSADALFIQFPEATLAGVLIAATCGLLGVFVILKRVVFIGIALSETAVCGIALASLAGLSPLAGALALTLGAVALLALPYETGRLPREAILGLVYLAATAGAILLVSHNGLGLMEIKALLYGDLILVSRAELGWLTAVLAPVALALLAWLRPLLSVFLDRDAARVMGLRVRIWELLFFAALGVAVASAAQVAGAGLVFADLIAPPAAALLLTRRLHMALALAAVLGILATLVGMGVSYRCDLPTNQTIIVAAGALPLTAAIWRGLRPRGKRRSCG